MLDGHRIGGLLLMGGVGKRFGSETPKQFHRLAGRCVFLHTLDAFLSTRLFDDIVLSCHPDWIERIRALLPRHPSLHLVSAGATRQESSYRGLLGFQTIPDIVVIHDAVRPFVTTDILLQNVRQALETGAADTCIPSADTLVHAPDRKAIASIPNRSEYLRGQTPQSFDYSLILRAHRETKRRDSSDDCQLVLDLGHPVSVVPGDEHNIKITSEMDLFLAEQLFRLRLQRGKCYRTASLKNQRFAIVGGSGGIGSAIAHRIEDLEGVAIALSRRTEPFHLDLRDPSSIQDVLRKIGPLDGLINCAGFLMVKSLEKLTPQEIEASIDVNLKGLILCCKMASLKKGAHVINIASSSFSRGRKDTSIYSSAKAAVVNFTQGWAEERPDLHIHALIPQRTNTAMRRQNFPNEEPQTLLDPKEVAEAAIDLLLEDELTGLMVEVRKDAFY